MPDRDTVGEASGKFGLAVYRNVDWEKFLSLVRYLPTLAGRYGTARAIAFGQTELRSMLGFFAFGPSTVEREQVSLFFEEGSMRLLCDPDDAGYSYQTAFLTVVLREYFLPSARLVFERTTERDLPYAPNIPTA